MTNIQTDKRITLRCKQDVKNPDVLYCERLRHPIPTKKEQVPQMPTKIPSPDKSKSDTVTPTSDVDGDAGSQGYTTITLHKVQLDGKVVYEPIDPVEDPELPEKDTSLGTETQPNQMEMEHRLAQSKGCDGKHCVVSRQASARRNKPALRNATGKGEGE
jgi:hypothetical protein